MSYLLSLSSRLKAPAPVAPAPAPAPEPQTVTIPVVEPDLFLSVSESVEVGHIHQTLLGEGSGTM